jgi:hypothetical protein
MSTKEFEEFLSECEKNESLNNTLIPLMKLTDKERMYIMKRLDSMNTEPKEILTVNNYLSFHW